MRGTAGPLMLHFAYGSNMSPTIMRKHAPLAQPIGVATLPDYRFLIMAQGYASVAPLRAKTVYGVLWRLTPRDCVTLAAWESIAGGLYRAAMLPVRQAGRRRMALVYLARSRAEAAPRGGYMEFVIAAALEWHLPDVYIDELRGWLQRRSRKLREFRWT
ncbi:MAG: gamma-glutamylcyclotransferase family protein [Xanthobacteraceae bacterium]